MPVQKDKLPFRSPNEKGCYRRAWKESHGNLLLSFAGVRGDVAIKLFGDDLGQPARPGRV